MKKFLATLAAAFALALAVPSTLAYYADVLPLCKSAVAISAPVDTSEDILAICTVPAGAMASNAALRITTLFSATNNANVKTVRVRYSGIGGTIHQSNAITSTAGGYGSLTIHNRGVTNSQVSGATFISSTGTVGSSIATTSAVDTTAVTTIVLTCQKATGTDTCTLESYLVELIGGGT